MQEFNLILHPPHQAFQQKYIKLEKNISNHYSWNTYIMGQPACIHRHDGALKTLIQHHITSDIWDTTTELYLIHNDKEQHVLVIGYIDIAQHQKNITFTMQTYHIHDHTITYNLNALYTLNAQDAGQYLKHHIPIDNIMHRFITQFPHQDKKMSGKLHHYFPPLSQNIPCATSEITNKHQGACSTNMYGQIDIDPPSLDDQYITIGTRINNIILHTPDICIDPEHANHRIIQQLRQHIYHTYLQRPEVKNLSQHEQLHIHRVFRDHGHEIAIQVYRDAIAHRAAHFQSTLFTFPKIPSVTSPP